jgi:hypothetical protein
VEHDFGGATALRAHFLNGRDYASLTLINKTRTKKISSS